MVFKDHKELLKLKEVVHFIKDGPKTTYNTKAKKIHNTKIIDSKTVWIKMFNFSCQ